MTNQFHEASGLPFDKNVREIFVRSAIKNLYGFVDGDDGGFSCCRVDQLMQLTHDSVDDGMIFTAGFDDSMRLSSLEVNAYEAGI